MANEYYQPGEQRAARVQDLFASIATRYDLINDLQSFGLHRAWKRRLVNLAAPAPGGRALDVCCGTGDIAQALAARGARVTGLDFSPAMLDVARGRTRRTDHPAPEFVEGDAQNLPFADGEFDLVTVGYGLRNLADWRRGLNEMWRVTRPGGSLWVLDFGKPENALWRRLYFAYLRWFVPVLGRWVGGNAPAYAYILQSLEQYPAQHGVAAAMGSLGCRNVRIVRFLGGVMTINGGTKA